MSQPIHPVDTLIAWVLQFPERERDELASLTSCTFLTIPHTPNDISGNQLVQWLQHVRDLPPRQSIALALGFCTAVEFFALCERRSKAGWDHLVKINHQVKEALLRKGHDVQVVAPIDTALKELPLRRKRWLQQAERWDTLRATALSNSNLRSWLEPKDRAWMLIPM